MQLRDYQKLARDSVINGFRQGQLSQLIILPTGSGKTIIFSHIIQNLKLKTLVVSHLSGLKEQNQRVCNHLCPELVLSRTIQHIHLVNYFDQIEKYDCIIIDEAHHAASNSYKKLIDIAKEKKKLLLGFTATPFRLDRKSVYKIFPHVAYETNILEMITNGYLCDIEGYRVKTNVDISKVRVNDGDFKTGELASIINTENRNELILNTYQSNLKDKKTLIFCVNIEHCEYIAKLFKFNGYNASAIHGKISSSHRKDLLKDFKKTPNKILTSCQILTEGFDEPTIEAIMMCRPTKSPGLYIQMVGRGLRIYPSKDKCILYELTDNAHNICDFSTLLTGQYSNWDMTSHRQDKSFSIRELSAHFDHKLFGKEIVIKKEDFLDKYDYKNSELSSNFRNSLNLLGIKFVEPITNEFAQILIQNHYIKKDLYGVDQETN